MSSTVIAGLILIPFVYYIWHTWLDIKINYKSKKLWICILLLSATSILNYLISIPLIKIVNSLIIFIISYKYFFNKKLKESIVIPFMIELLYIFSEVIFSSIVMAFLKEGAKEFVSNYFGSLTTNFGISLMVLVLSKLKYVKRIIKKLDKLIDNVDEIKLLFLICLLTFIFSIYAVNTFYKLNSSFMIICSFIIVALAYALSFIFIKTKNDYYHLIDRYNSSLISLKELEKALTNHRIDNHENKNHLMTIRNMTKNKKVTNFIDSILDNNIEDDKRIMQETSIIPAGGLRGLIYSKLLLMNSKNIDYELDVSSEVRLVDILDYDDYTMLDICKIVGIFLDNAIEEMDNVEDKYIVIELYKDEDIFKISITNTFDNSVDKSNISKAGVSTKGGNHGYGLSLVKKIIKENDKLKTINEITEEEFTQILEIYK